ncbi:hypothetical protein ElyMa_000978100 [Elysia marginata]|uniref:Uncharacterized protein n=1 Tax=Elysia marginata TaxID=1093978 RepID=A0AAV4HI65_9GAST|nr:hypothetical protein ElyMa_000978100 [Elysia marginata]
MTSRASPANQQASRGCEDGIEANTPAHRRSAANETSLAALLNKLNPLVETDHRKTTKHEGGGARNKARGKRGTLLSRHVSTCTRIGFTVTVAGHLVTAGHFVCRFTSQHYIVVIVVVVIRVVVVVVVVVVIRVVVVVVVVVIRVVEVVVVRVVVVVLVIHYIVVIVVVVVVVVMVVFY